MTVTLEQSNLLMSWRDVQKRIAAIDATLAPLKKEEKQLRDAIGEAHFKTAISGTQRKGLGGGYNLKGVVRHTYKINKGPDGTYNNVAQVLTALPAMASELVKWTPELSVTAFKKLTAEEQKLLEPILTITAAISEVEIEEPKAS